MSGNVQGRAGLAEWANGQLEMAQHIESAIKFRSQVLDAFDQLTRKHSFRGSSSFAIAAGRTSLAR
jgi:hypothetical protein